MTSTEYVMITNIITNGKGKVEQKENTTLAIVKKLEKHIKIQIECL